MGGGGIRLSNYAKQQILRMETASKFPYLIEITRYKDDGTVNDISRYVNSDKNIVFEGNTYEAGYFTLTPPEKQQNTFSNATLTISAVDQTWIQKIRETQKRAKIRFVAVIQYDDENNVEQIEAIDDLEFELTKAEWDENTIQWTMEFDSLISIKIPTETCNELSFPCLG